MPHINATAIKRSAVKPTATNTARPNIPAKTMRNTFLFLICCSVYVPGHFLFLCLAWQYKNILRPKVKTRAIGTKKEKNTLTKFSIEFPPKICYVLYCLF